VEVFHETETDELILLDGMHRWRASLAYGFAELPCLMMDRDRAEVCRGYVPRRRGYERLLTEPSLCKINDMRHVSILRHDLTAAVHSLKYRLIATI
jgi:hypothetical protein